MVEINQNQNNLTSINVSSVSKNQVYNTIQTDTSLYYSQLAREWAIRTNDKVAGLEYSAKYYSQKTKADSEAALAEINNTISTAKSDLASQTSQAIDSIDAEGRLQIAQAAAQVTLAAEQAQLAADSVQQANNILSGCANINFSNITDSAKTVIKENGGVWGYIQGEINDQSDLAEELANKTDLDLSNCTRPYVIETYVNGTSGYRVYSDGWCMQWGKSNGISGRETITLTKAYNSTNFTVLATAYTDNFYGTSQIVSNSSIWLESRGHDYTVQPCFVRWLTMGYIS